MPQDPKEVRCIEAALDWISDHKVKPIRVEEAQYSRLHKICGRPDFIGYVDGCFLRVGLSNPRKVCIQKFVGK